MVRGTLWPTPWLGLGVDGRLFLMTTLLLGGLDQAGVDLSVSGRWPHAGADLLVRAAAGPAWTEVAPGEIAPTHSGRVLLGPGVPRAGPALNAALEVDVALHDHPHSDLVIGLRGDLGVSAWGAHWGSVELVFGLGWPLSHGG